jgi:hypothetical protein
VSAAGCGRLRGKRGNAAMGHRHVGAGHTVSGCGSILVLNRFKNIQMVQMKFEFLQTLASSKGTFPCSKNLK